MKNHILHTHYVSCHWSIQMTAEDQLGDILIPRSIGPRSAETSSSSTLQDKVVVLDIAPADEGHIANLRLGG